MIKGVLPGNLGAHYIEIKKSEAWYSDGSTISTVHFLLNKSKE